MASENKHQTFLYRIIDRLVGEENLVQFREDFKWIVYNNMKKFNRWNPSQQYLQKETLAAKNKARRSTWDRVGFIIGLITSLSVFFPLPSASLLSITGVFISLLTALRRVTVTMLLFDDPYRIYNHRRLKFACAWNRAMNGWTSLCVMPLGILNTITPEKYNIGLWVLENAVQNRYD